jgi:hypothetical protein
MALDERFIISEPLQQQFVDRDSGLPLSFGTLEFFRDKDRGTGKNVYQITGTDPNYSYVSMGAILTLNGSGQIVNSLNTPVALYLYPFFNPPGSEVQGDVDLYYVVAKNSDGIIQWTRQAWPNLTAASDPTKDGVPVENQIANPQFTRTFINPNATQRYAVSGSVDAVFKFAPDWEFVISGTGNVIIERKQVDGNLGIPTSPAYVLDVNVSAGITKCQMRQRMFKNSGLWASTSLQPIFLSSAVVGKSEGVNDGPLKMFYQESGGINSTFPVEIMDVLLSIGGYQEFQGTTDDPIPASTNPDLSDSAYIDILVDFGEASHVSISSVQVVPSLTSTSPDIIQYDVRTANREQALLGDYYIPALERKRTESLLTGWDFPVSPFQLGDTGTVPLLADQTYITDQTIAGATSFTMAWSRATDTGGIEFQAADFNNAFYIMQYLDGAEAKKILTNRMS